MHDPVRDPDRIPCVCERTRKSPMEPWHKGATRFRRRGGWARKICR